MKLFHYGKDGGKDSTVWGFWLIEAKSWFSIALLCFENGSREAFHSHAFNSWSWVLKGNLMEQIRTTQTDEQRTLICGWTQWYNAGSKRIFTPRDRMHKVQSVGRSWVLTFRGPWSKTWKEYLPNEDKTVTLTQGRNIVPTT